MQQAWIFGVGCLAGIVLGYIETVILHVRLNPSTVLLLAVATVVVVNWITEGRSCRWQTLSASFLLSWVGAVFILPLSQY